MTAKSIIGIIILALNLAGVCFMAIMIFTASRKKSKATSIIHDRAMKRKKSQLTKSQPPDPLVFNKADYLLDDIDLSEFDDFDFDQNNNEEKLNE